MCVCRRVHVCLGKSSQHLLRLVHVIASTRRCGSCMMPGLAYCLVQRCLLWVREEKSLALEEQAAADYNKKKEYPVVVAGGGGRRHDDG